MARASQNEKGSCAALPSAATSTPAAATWPGTPSRVVSASRERSVRPASAAAVAAYRPRSANRVVRKAVSPDATRWGSVQRYPMRA